MFNLVNIDIIQSLLKKHNFAPNKFLGQNFLINEEVLEKIIATADIKEGDNVIEIGPGLGVLTQVLLAKGANVVAIEKDKELIPVLEENLGICKMDIDQSEPKHPRLHGEPHNPLMHSRTFRFASNNNISIINDDFLQVEFGKIRSGFEKKLQDRSEFRYKVISNIPYYITSPVIRKIFSFSILPTEIVFLVQREVAERIAAPAGEMSLVSLYVQFYGTPSVVEIVKPESFLPAPKVESAILKIVVNKNRTILSEQPALLRPASAPLAQNISKGRSKAMAGKQGFEGSSFLSLRQAANKAEEEKLWHLAKIGFSSRRKTLANNLAAGFRRKNSEIKELLKKAGFGENARAQELSVMKWIELLRVMRKLK